MVDIKDKNGNVLYSIQFAHYGEERDINATDGEIAIADHIQALCPTSKFVRMSDSYVTVKCVETDICRFKYTERTKWLLFPYLKDNKKRYIDSLEDLTKYDDEIRESYAFACSVDRSEDN